MLKLTRLNRSIVAINPDQILWVEASPDTTLFLVAGDKLIVRETLDELVDAFVELKRRIHGDAALLGRMLDRSSILPTLRPSRAPASPSHIPPLITPHIGSRPPSWQAPSPSFSPPAGAPSGSLTEPPVTRRDEEGP